MIDWKLNRQLQEMRQAGTYKVERAITSRQAGRVSLDGRDGVLNLCANNYLGLADSPEIIGAAHAALDRYGFGMASVRFICGTQDIHRALEEEIAQWLGADDAILFPSAFDANGGVFEALLGEGDAIISDALNHASIIDGIRLSKAARYRYANCDMTELEACLKSAQGAQRKLVVTDGVFSMDGTIAPLKEICDLADRYGAMVMIDDAHSHGVLGERGSGTPSHRGVEGRIQIVTGTLGKALGGASGGFVAASRDIVDWLRNRARPYLFSNSVAPALVAGARQALTLAREGAQLRRRLHRNTRHWRQGLAEAGFTLLPGEHPIVPVMLGDAKLAAAAAAQLQQRGVYVTAFSYPVVPMGKARIRTQMNAALSTEDLDQGLAAFRETGRDLGLLDRA